MAANDPRARVNREAAVGFQDFLLEDADNKEQEEVKAGEDNKDSDRRPKVPQVSQVYQQMHHLDKAQYLHGYQEVFHLAGLAFKAHRMRQEYNLFLPSQQLKLRRQHL